MKNLSKKKDIYTLEKTIYHGSYYGDFNKGLGHDRQHLGIILAAGNILKVRKISGNIPLILKLLNDDGNNESVFSISHEWSDIYNNTASVPFIETPYGDDTVAIEYQYPEHSKTLPVYKKNDSEADFFSLWDSNHSEFSLISNFYFNMLVPVCDKEFLRGSVIDKKIDQLIDHYEKIFRFYNKLAGFSFEGYSVTDKNIPNKYFIKANKHGVGEAYYSHEHTAANSHSIANFWLNLDDTKWGPLHEIAHGYQGDFMIRDEFSIGEVWNNIYAATYQDIYLGKKVFTEGWLYGESQKLFDTIGDYIHQKIPVNDWEYREKLYFFMLMNEAAGEGFFSNFNKKYRQLSSGENFSFNGYQLLDLLSDSYATLGKVDVVPFIKRVGGNITQQQSEMNFLLRTPVVYPLNLLINKSSLIHLQTTLNVKTPFSLVSPSQLASTSIKGNMKITFTIDDFKQIYAENLILMEGERYAYHIRIKNKELKLMNIPVGGYTLILPTGKSSKYDIDKKYAIIKQGDNRLLVNYQLKKKSLFIQQEFRFLGLEDNLFSSINIDLDNKILFLKVLNKNPHLYFKGKSYAQIFLKSSSGEVLFKKNMEGTDVTLLSEKIDFKIGDYLEIFHAEPTRLTLINGGNKNNANFSQSNIFLLTELGLKHNLIDPKENLKIVISEKANQLRQHPHILSYQFASPKDDIYLAIDNFTGKERDELLKLYQDVLPKENSVPNQEVSDFFNIQLNGLNDSPFLTVAVDRANNKITFETKRTHQETPHSFFKNQTYAYISYVDCNGVEKYKSDFIGTLPLTIEKKEFQLSEEGGEQLYIHHREAVQAAQGGAKPRFILNNRLQNKLMAVSINNIYQLTPAGIKVVQSSDEDHFGYPLTLVNKIDNNKTNINNNSIFLAVEEGNIALIESLLSEGADINQVNNKGGSPLFLAVAKNKREITEYLLDRGANVNKINTNGITPLFLAVNKKHEKIAISLLDHGANVNQTFSNGETLLCWVVDKGDIIFAKMLVEKGADVNQLTKNGQTLLSLAKTKGHTALAEFLFISSKENQLTPKGDRNLLLAVKQGNIELAQSLLDEGVDVNQVNEQCDTPLCLAVVKGNIELAEILLDYNAEVNKRNGKGDTPLSLAIENNLIEFVQSLIIYYSADVNQLTTQGDSMLSLAREKGHTDLVELLVDYIEEDNEIIPNEEAKIPRRGNRNASEAAEGLATAIAPPQLFVRPLDPAKIIRDCHALTPGTDCVQSPEVVHPRWSATLNPTKITREGMR
jgi:ankyrin repeat protein